MKNLEEIKESLGEKFSRDADFLNSIINDLKLPKNSQILDVGTGWGFMAIALALHDYKVITGEPENAKWADWRSRAKIANVDDKITFKPFHAENLPFEDDIFDAIFLYTSLHHVKDKNHAISEMIRVMKRDGYLIIIELTEKGVKKIRQRHINHPDAVNPKDFTKNFNLEVTVKESRYLNAYIYRNKHFN
ncbi:MAG: class I SAM-dependent methyltransferase [Promethearchaeota archaeon]|nr:MAG: class I SAM-dependent methyltransferase [Candidatus Lokiarchaeota archaeon]